METDFEAHMDGVIVGMLTAYENDLGDEAAAIWSELTPIEQEYAMIGCLGWLAGALEEIERRGGPSAIEMVQGLARP